MMMDKDKHHNKTSKILKISTKMERKQRFTNQTTKKQVQT